MRYGFLDIRDVRGLRIRLVLATSSLIYKELDTNGFPLINPLSVADMFSAYGYGVNNPLSGMAANAIPETRVT